jgi:hypothetical protein
MAESEPGTHAIVIFPNELSTICTIALIMQCGIILMGKIAGPHRHAGGK